MGTGSRIPDDKKRRSERVWVLYTGSISTDFILKPWRACTIQTRSMREKRTSPFDCRAGHADGSSSTCTPNSEEEKEAKRSTRNDDTSGYRHTHSKSKVERKGQATSSNGGQTDRHKHHREWNHLNSGHACARVDTFCMPPCIGHLSSVSLAHRDIGIDVPR